MQQRDGVDLHLHLASEFDFRRVVYRVRKGFEAMDGKSGVQEGKRHWRRAE